MEKSRPPALVPNDTTTTTSSKKRSTPTLISMTWLNNLREFRVNNILQRLAQRLLQGLAERPGKSTGGGLLPQRGADNYAPFCEVGFWPVSIFKPSLLVVNSLQY